MRKLLVLTVLALAAAWVGPASAAEQTLAGQTAQLKNPKPDPGGDPTKRSVKGQAKEAASPNTVVGNPTVGGAKLKVKTDTGEQCYDMPASGWALSGTIGYKYKDSKTVNSAINSAQIKKANNGQFQLKFGGKAKTQPITIIPPTSTLSYNLSILNGDDYCGSFGSPTKNDAKQSKFGISPDPGSCAATSCYVCGDSIVRAPETCDDGGESATCDTDCTAAVCGDGTVNATAGEFCDTSGVDTAGCDAGDCTAPACGDGYFNAAAGEACDTGGVDTAGCDAGDCTLPMCGDSYVNMAAGEVCDPPGSAFGSGPPTDNGLCDGCLSPSGAFLDGTILE
jgi:hypothetical protein